jgi:hypothetical protein
MESIQSNKSSNHTNMPDQLASESEKFSKEWYIPMADYVIATCVRNADKSEITKLLNVANGYIPEEEFRYITKLYGDDGLEEELNKMPIRHIDFLDEIKDKYMGEFSKSYYYYQVYSLDSDSISLMNKQLESMIYSACMQELINILNEQAEAQKQQLAQQESQEGIDTINQQQPIDTGKESQDIGDVDKFIKEFKDNWKDERVIKAQQRLEFINQTLEVKDKYTTAFYYWWATESCYTYREVIGDMLYFYIISPLDYYRCHNGNKFVEDDDYGVWKQYVSFQGLIDVCRQYLSKDELKEVVSLHKYLSSGGDLAIPIVKWNEMKIFLDTREDNSIPGIVRDNTGERILFNKASNIEIYRYAYKTPIKHKRLLYMTLSGEVKEKLVTNDYELDESNGDISVHDEWINKVIMGIRIGSAGVAIYSKPRYCECQRERLNNESICKLPFNGISYMVAENARNPVTKRLEDYVKLYRIFTAQLERAANKFRDLLIMPESIMLDSDQMTAAQRLNRANLDSLYPFNDTDTTSSLLQSIREVYTQGVERYITAISNLRTQVRQEALAAVNFNEAREGNLGQYAGKATTEYAMNIAQTGTAWMLDQFNEFRQRDMAANFDWSKVAWVDGMRGSYVDSNTGEVIYLDIDANEGLLDNIGINIMHSAQLEEQIQQLKQYAFNMGQNGNEIVAVESITNRNISQLKKIIKEAGDNVRKFQIDMQKATEEAKQQTETIKAQAKQEEQARELEMLQLKLQSESETAIKVAQIHYQEAIDVMNLRISSGEQDSDGDGYMDNYNKSKETADKTAVEREKLDVQREKNMQDYEVNTEKNRIAASKPQSSSK